jgi:hypothetical protein
MVSANYFLLAAQSAEPRLPSLREGKREEGDRGGKDIVKRSMVVVRSQEALFYLNYCIVA